MRLSELGKVTDLSITRASLVARLGAIRAGTGVEIKFLSESGATLAEFETAEYPEPSALGGVFREVKNACAAYVGKRIAAIDDELKKLDVTP